MKERITWVLIALSTLLVGWFGYHRLREVRPDIFDPGYSSAGQPSEQERQERIKAYQDKSHGLAWSRDPVKPAANQKCVDGFLQEAGKQSGNTDARRVLRDGKPVACGEGK